MTRMRWFLVREPTIAQRTSGKRTLDENVSPSSAPRGRLPPSVVGARSIYSSARGYSATAGCLWSARALRRRAAGSAAYGRTRSRSRRSTAG